MFTRRLDALRLHMIVMGFGLVVALVFLLGSGALGGRHHGMIAIEWGAYPDRFKGLDVEVDGRVVGELAYLGSRPVSGFEVTEGPHEVRVVSEEWPSTPLRVDVKRDRTRRFLLDLQETATADGQAASLVLQ